MKRKQSVLKRIWNRMFVADPRMIISTPMLNKRNRLLGHVEMVVEVKKMRFRTPEQVGGNHETARGKP